MFVVDLFVWGLVFACCLVWCLLVGVDVYFVGLLLGCFVINSALVGLLLGTICFGFDWLF